MVDFAQPIAQPAAAPLAAPQPAADVIAQPGDRAHDGFMLRLTSALLLGSMRETGDGFFGDGTKTTMFGIGGTLGVAAGYAVVENFDIHLRLSLVSGAGVGIEVNGSELADEATVSTLAFSFGPGLSYVFMPINLYVALAVGPTWFTSGYLIGDDQDDRSDGHGTKAGIALSLDVGKEWWISRQWGMGAALSFWFARTTLEDPDLGWDLKQTMIMVGPAFSATWQ